MYRSIQRLIDMFPTSARRHKTRCTQAGWAVDNLASAYGKHLSNFTPKKSGAS